MALERLLFPIAVRVVVASLCCWAIFCCWKLVRADALFRQNTAESVRSAIRFAPDASQYYMRLSQLDEGHARDLLESAVRLNRYNAQAYIELGLEYEAAGDYARAEKMLQTAYEVDHTYLPRWSLANFYLRRDDMPGFWTWARNAAQIPADDISSLFELCWRVSPDPEIIAGAILNDNPELIRQYLAFLLRKQQLPSAAAIAPRLVRFGLAETDRPLLFFVVNRLVAAKNGIAAKALWRLLVDDRWAVADLTMPNNGNFAREPLPVSFDWSLASFSGLHSWPGLSGLETEFTGSQPENCIIADQALVLSPGNYRMDFSFRTTDIHPDTGLRWQIIDADSDTTVANSLDLSSDTLKQETVEFSVPPGASLIRLRLAYQRAVGTPRISGTLVIPSIHISSRS